MRKQMLLGGRQILLVLVVVILVFGLTASFLLHLYLKDQKFTETVIALSQKNLDKYGLELQINNLHWQNWDTITGNKVRLIDPASGEVVMGVKSLRLKVDLWAVFKYPGRPERCLREIELIKPQVKLERFSDKTWNMVRYFGSKERDPKNKFYFKMAVTLREGEVKLKDYQFGTHNFSGINGRVDFTTKRQINWSVQGKADLNLGAAWQAKGSLTLDNLAGESSLIVNQVLCEKFNPWLPPSFKGVIDAGRGDMQLEVAWRNKDFWLKKGSLQVVHGGLFVPQIEQVIGCKRLVADFTPNSLQIKQADLEFEKTALQVRGKIDLNSMAVAAVVKAQRLQLADLQKYFFKKQEFSYTGLADGSLQITGPIRRPVIEGDLTLKDCQVNFGKEERLTNLSGRIQVVRNNLQINAAGRWRQARIDFKGKINNLYNPVYDLQIGGRNIALNSFNNNGAPVVFRGNNYFQGVLRGKWQIPVFTGKAYVDSMQLERVILTKMRAAFDWQLNKGQLQIKQFQSASCNGKIQATGELLLGKEEMSWLLFASAADFDVQLLKELRQLPVKGFLEATAVAKGVWRYNETFSPGCVNGTFIGNGIGYNEMQLPQVKGSFNLTDHLFRIDSFVANLGAGEIFGGLVMDLNQEEMNLKIDVENLNLQSIISSETVPFAGVFSGRMSFTGPVADLSGKIVGSLAEVVWDQKKVGLVSGEVWYRQGIFSLKKTSVISESGRYLLEGQFDLQKAKPLVQLRVTNHNVKLADLIEWFPVDQGIKLDGIGSIDFQIFGEFFDPGFKGKIHLKKPKIAHIEMEEAVLLLQGNINQMQIEKFELINQESKLTLSGLVDRENIDLVLVGESFNLSYLNLGIGDKKLQGVVTLRGELKGSPAAPQLITFLYGNEIKIGSLYYDSLKARINYNRNRVQISDTQLKREDSSVSVFGQVLLEKETKLDLGVKVDDYDIKDLLQFVEIPDLGLAGKLSGWIRTSGTTANPSIRLIGDLDGGMIGKMPFTGEFDLFYNQNRVDIQRVMLKNAAGKGTLTTSGAWENNNLLKLNIDLKDFPLDSLNTFLGQKTTESKRFISGNANSQIALQLSRQGIKGDYQLAVQDFVLNEVNWGEFESQGSLRDRGLVIREGRLKDKKEYFSFSGFFPWTDEVLKSLNLPRKIQKVPDELKINLSLQHLPAKIASQLFATMGWHLEMLSGEVNGQLAMGGKLPRPLFYGTIRGNNLKLKSAELPVPIENLRTQMVFAGERVIFKETQGAYGKGDFTLTGQTTISFVEDPEFKFGLSGNNLYYKNSQFNGFTDVNVTLQGTAKKSIIAGKATIYNCKAGGLRLELGPKEELTWTPDLDLAITIGANSRYRQVGLANLVITGDLKAKGNITDPQLEGRVTSDKGTIIYGKTFKANQVEAVFHFQDGINPSINVDSSLVLPEAEIFLSIKGKVDEQLTIKLSSIPFMTEKEIYTLLNWSEIQEGLKGDRPLNVNEIVAGNLTSIADPFIGDILYEVKNALGLDYFYPDYNLNNNDLRIVFGKYLTDRLMGSYSRSFSYGDTNAGVIDSWRFDYRLTPNLNVGGTYDKEQGSIFSLSYQIGF